MSTDELYRMAYRGECDGHDREWHRTTAKNRRELDALHRGAEAARRDLAAEEAAFVPDKAGQATPFSF